MIFTKLSHICLHLLCILSATPESSYSCANSLKDCQQQENDCESELITELIRPELGSFQDSGPAPTAAQAAGKAQLGPCQQPVATPRVFLCALNANHAVTPDKTGSVLMEMPLKEKVHE